MEKMEVSFQEKSPKISLPLEDDEAKYVSRLSTILVATIQEVKDRVSQIEYVFCSQLYPNVQKSSKSFQKLYSEARQAVEGEWKERVCELELRLKQACEDSDVLKVEKSKLVGKIADLEEKLLQKSKEVDEGMGLHAKLLDLLESKTSIIAEKETQMKEQEERIKLLMSRIEGLESNIVALNNELQEKNKEVVKGEELRKELMGQIESQRLKIMSSKQMLNDKENECGILSMKLVDRDSCILSLEDRLKRKCIEVEEGNKKYAELVQQANRFAMKDQQLSAYEKEKTLLLSRINDLENEVGVLQENLKNGIAGINEKQQNDLAQQIELKSSELASEKQKSRDLLAAYKRLKSQHNFLLVKYGFTNEDLLPQMKEEGGNDPTNKDHRSLIPPEVKKRNLAAGELSKVKTENESMESSDGERASRSTHVRSCRSPSSSNSPAETRWTTKGNAGSSAGTKRPASAWRDTRSRQSPGGPDPHDDFLDTPYENIRHNLRKSTNNNVQDVPAQATKDKESTSSDDDDDDETQDLNAEPASKKQQLEPPKPVAKGFKYVEPVRKKAERENLNGVECKQCKKFYDAVLSDAKGKDGQVDQKKFRCEHHDGVSRHRYRYAPPMTPEGFWNIGFDTET